MFKNLILIAVFAFGSSAFANDLTNLKVVGQDYFQGQKVLPLHALANQKLKAMGEDAGDFELVGVTIEAKSKAGKGTATLIVGNDQDTRRVEKFGGSDIFFNITAPWAYHTMHWDLSGAEGKPNERWRMRFNGNIKVHSVQLHVATSVKRVRIPMGDALYTQDTLIGLKRTLRQMGHNVRNAQLKRVVLVAKSRAGKARARVLIGPNGATPVKVIGRAQNGFNFQSDAPRSYDRVRFTFMDPTPGRWQVDMRGRIKMKAIIVEFK